MSMNIPLQRRLGAILPLLVASLFLSFSPTASEENVVDATTAGADYRVGVGDLLEISVFGFDQFHKTLRIGGAGTIRLPLLEEVAVEGRTVSEIEEMLSRLLKEAELFKDPDVNVKVQEYRSQTVFVLGRVRQPGQYHLTRPSRLIDVLSMAGGVQDERADDRAIIERYRESAEATNSSAAADPAAKKPVETISVDLEELLENGDLSLNHWVLDGDVVTVPEREIKEFFIIGEVNRPGAFEMDPDEGLLLSQALARAGGPMKTAKLGKGILARFGKEGEREEIAINVEKILEGKEEDVPIMPDDVIFIPGSTFKSIGYGLLGAIPRTVSETIVTGRYR